MDVSRDEWRVNSYLMMVLVLRSLICCLHHFALVNRKKMFSLCLQSSLPTPNNKSNPWSKCKCKVSVPSGLALQPVLSQSCYCNPLANGAQDCWSPTSMCVPDSLHVYIQGGGKFCVKLKILSKPPAEQYTRTRALIESIGAWDDNCSSGLELKLQQLAVLWNGGSNWLPTSHSQSATNSSREVQSWPCM